MKVTSLELHHYNLRIFEYRMRIPIVVKFLFILQYFLLTNFVHFITAIRHIFCVIKCNASISSMKFTFSENQFLFIPSCSSNYEGQIYSILSDVT